jgi:hypothetical protein
MNILVLIAGVFALFATIGHFTMGVKLYLRPLMQTDVDLVVKNIFKGLFHYSSVFLVTSTVLLIRTGIAGEGCMFDPFMAHAFICANYLLMGLSQIIIALSSSVKNPLAKMFQWVFWLIIGGLILTSLIG